MLQRHPLQIEIQDLSGQTLLRAGHGHPVRLLDFSGIESAEVKVNISEKALLDGAYIDSFRAESRRITLDLDFIETAYAWADIPRLFPMKKPVKIKMRRDDNEREIIAYRDSAIEPLGNRGLIDPVVFQISFISEAAFLSDSQKVVQVAGEIIGGLEYKPTIEYDPVIQYESFNAINRLSVNNMGDYPVGFTVDATFIQPVSYFSISSGRQLMRFSALSAGQTLSVDTERKTVTIDGENGFAWLEEGAFFDLPLGESIVIFSDFIGVANLSFTQLYEGV